MIMPASKKSNAKTDPAVKVAIITAAAGVLTVLITSVVAPIVQKSLASAPTVVPSQSIQPSLVNTPASTNLPSPTSEPPTSHADSGPMFGPVDGKLVHDPDGGVIWYQAEVQLRDFVAEASFSNPYSSSEHLWNDVIFFRDRARVWVNSDGTWGYTWLDDQNNWHDHDGKLPLSTLATQAGERNLLRLIAYGSGGCFYVNNKFVGDLDLKDMTAAGPVAVGISEKEYTRSGATTNFENFEIFTTTNLNCPK
jgi:hypothetical protein